MYERDHEDIVCYRGVLIPNCPDQDCSRNNLYFIKRHTRTYLKHFGFGADSFIPCEVCGGRAVDIHHIDCRGMGGSKEKDEIGNLMALCREHHLFYGDKKQYTQFLKNIHQEHLDIYG